MKNKKIIYFANINSPHIKRWLEVSNSLNIDVEIVTVHKLMNDNSEINVNNILPKWAENLGILKYIIAGIISRKYLKNKKFNIIHAHNTSGYGLMALISGYKYIITTYGSEIYEAKQRGIIYTNLIKYILNKSYKITATSIKMKDTLMSKCNIAEDKINLFSMGINNKIFYQRNTNLRSLYNIKDNDRVWIINRRVLPLYNTYEVVNGFIDYVKNTEANDKLIIICGDYSHQYLLKVKSIVNINNIIFVDELLTQNKIAEFLSISDFAISVPKTDQLSASILEAISCETIPILSNIDAYNILKDNNVGIFVSGFSKIFFREVFLQTSQLSSKQIKLYLKNGKYYMKEYESTELVQENLSKLYNTKENNK